MYEYTRIHIHISYLHAGFQFFFVNDSTRNIKKCINE